jgi:hypothetical protein
VACSGIATRVRRSFWQEKRIVVANSVVQSEEIHTAPEKPQPLPQAVRLENLRQDHSFIFTGTMMFCVFSAIFLSISKLMYSPPIQPR